MSQPVQVNFDATSVEPTTPYEVLPAASYNVSLIRAETKETAKKDGHYIACTFVVQDGEYKGRQLFENLNIWNANEKAREIAWRNLSGICHAAERLQIGVMDELYGIMISATVAIEQDEKYGPSNRIKAFTKLAGAPAATWNTPPPAPAPAPTAPTNWAPPAPTAPPAVSAPIAGGPAVAPPWATK